MIFSFTCLCLTAHPFTCLFADCLCLLACPPDCLCQPTYPTVCPHVPLSLSAHIPDCLPTCPTVSVCLPARLTVSVSPHTRLSAHMPHCLCLPTCLFIFLPACLPAYRPTTCQHVYLRVFQLSVSLHVCSSVCLTVFQQT